MEEMRRERPLCKRLQRTKRRSRERNESDDGKRTKAKILSRNSIATAGTVESTVTGLKLVGRHVQRHQKRRVKEVQEK